MTSQRVVPLEAPISTDEALAELSPVEHEVMVSRVLLKRAKAELDSLRARVAELEAQLAESAATVTSADEVPAPVVPTPVPPNVVPLPPHPAAD